LTVYTIVQHCNLPFDINFEIWTIHQILWNYIYSPTFYKMFTWDFKIKTSFPNSEGKEFIVLFSQIVVFFSPDLNVCLSLSFDLFMLGNSLLTWRMATFCNSISNICPDLLQAYLYQNKVIVNINSSASQVFKLIQTFAFQDDLVESCCKDSIEVLF